MSIIHFTAQNVQWSPGAPNHIGATHGKKPSFFLNIQSSERNYAIRSQIDDLYKVKEINIHFFLIQLSFRKTRAKYWRNNYHADTPEDSVKTESLLPMMFISLKSIIF